MDNTKKCCICQRPAQVLVKNDSDIKLPPYSVCSQCYEYFLRDKYIDKYATIEKALKLSSETGISMPYAVNVALNKYTLKEAKRRDKLKKMEKDGRSVDMFDIRRRVSGSFGSKQK